VKDKGNLNTYKGAKKPPKYKPRELRALKIAACRNADESVLSIARIAGMDGTHKTVAKYLKQMGFQSVVRAKVPKLTQDHVEKRLKFVDLHLNKGVDSG
jgi:phenylalanyl-tRNA synthetase beta subunit